MLTSILYRMNFKTKSSCKLLTKNLYKKNDRLYLMKNCVCCDCIIIYPFNSLNAEKEIDLRFLYAIINKPSPIADSAAAIDSMINV